MAETCSNCGHYHGVHTPTCTVEGCACKALADEGERQSCPRRVQSLGPWSHDDDKSDRWDHHSWSGVYSTPDGCGGTWPSFPQGFERPRTCSHCGGVHPEDAITLLHLGWEVEATTKSYKRYLEPPGYTAAMESALRNEEHKVVRSPAPPVKVYVQHFNEDQISRFNALLKVSPGAM
jgi:hypothetical protein